MAESQSNSSSDDIVPTTKKLWNESNNERTHILYSKLMVSMTSRTLDLEDFLNYVSQEIHVLFAFNKAYRVAMGSSDYNDAHEEICNLWTSIIQSFGLMRETYSAPNAATIKYTDFVLATATANQAFEGKKLQARIASVTTARLSLYAFLGKQIQAVLDPSKGIHPNHKWIDYISSDTFQAQAMQTEEFLEKLCVSLTGDDLGYIEKLYHQAMKLQVEFFLALPLLRETIAPLCEGPNLAGARFMLFCSFDLTCTVLDSSAVLAELAISKSDQSDKPPAEGQLAWISGAIWRTMWDEISDLYTDEYQKCMESILVVDKKEQFGYQGLEEASQIISALAKNMKSRGRSLQLLKGLKVDDIKRAGELMIFQDGCLKFFDRARKDPKFFNGIHVISYCWSTDMIESAFSSGGLDAVNVYANQLIYEDSITTGKVNWRILCPMDKVKNASDILKHYGTDGKHVSVYIGDTVGDFLCLLGADIGIVIGSSPSLRRLGARCGVTFLPLFTYVVELQERFYNRRPAVKRKLLFTVSSWAEIHAFFLGF